MTVHIPQRVGVQQRVLPSYRVPFFDMLAEQCGGGLSVFAGEPRKDEALSTSARPEHAQFTKGRNIHLFSGRFYLCWQAGLLEWLRKWQPDVLIMEANPRYLFSPTARRWVKARGGKVIGWGLGSPEPKGSLANLRFWLRRRFVKQFDALVTYSQQGAAEYAQLGFDAGCIFIAPNAVAPRPRHTLPERLLTYQAGKPVILFVGRLQPRKRVDLLIRACASLKRYQPLLWIVGDGPYRHELEQLADEIYPDTRFYGAQHGTDLAHLMHRADLFVLPGTGGLAVQQAMSYALPVIVGVSDGTQSNLVQETNGWILPEQTTEVLAALISDALGNIRRLRRMGEASFHIVHDEVNLENMAAAFCQAIHSVSKETE